jgi:outer membrane lipoprotein SlyB
MRLFSTSIDVRSTLFLIFFSAVPCALLAQANQASWSALSGLRPGQKIEVADTSSKKHSGTFLNVSDTAISTQGNASEQTTLRPQVRSVRLMESSHRMRNALIGAGIGAGAGGGITAAAWEQHGFLGSKGTGAAVGAIIGGVAGAIVGVLSPSHKTIYSVSPH